MFHTHTIAAVALAALLSPAAAMYPTNGPVLQLNSKTYDSLIAKSNHTSIVEFYAPWCGHCQKLAPAYEKAAKSLRGLAKVAAVDCDADANKQFCGTMGVQGFPTLKIVRPGKKPGRPMVEDYQGARSAKAIVDAVIDKIPNHVKRLKDADYEDWVADVGPKAILFTDKGTVSALLKSVAIEFLGALNVGQIRNKETAAVEAFEIENFPTLVLLPGDGKEPVVYDDELKKDQIVKFLSQAASPNPETSTKDSSKSGSKKTKASKPSSKPAKANDDAGPEPSESTDDDPTHPPNPQVHAQKPAKKSDGGPAKPITSLQDGVSLQHKCLNDKAGTCVLALLPEETEPSDATVQTISALSELHKKHESASRNLFPFYQIPHANTQGETLRSKMKLKATGVEIIAINGKRSWWRHFPHDKVTIQNIEDWVDAIRMGDGKKSDIPKGLIVDQASLPEEPVNVEKEDKADDSAGQGKAKSGPLPGGVQFDMENLPDGLPDEVRKIMENLANQGSADEHDEL